MRNASLLWCSASETVAALLQCRQRHPVPYRVYCPVCGYGLQCDDIVYCAPNGDIAGCEQCLRKQYVPDAVF